MKKVFTLLAVVLFSCLSSASVLSTPDTLTVLFVNDSHSFLAPGAPRTEALAGTKGGFARAVSVIELTEATDSNVISLHSGDYSIGDLFYNAYFGAAELQMLRLAGFDALTLGNHEFDLTPMMLLSVFTGSFVDDTLPILSANAVMEDPTVAGLKDFVKPYTIKEYDNFKVGVFGLTTPEANILSLPSPVVIDDDIMTIALNSINALTAQGCDVIICLSHLGVNLDKLLAANLPGINLIVGGHDHLRIDPAIEVENPAGETTYIVQTEGFYSSVGIFKFELNDGEVNFVNHELIDLDETVPEEPMTKAMIDQLAANVESVYGPVYTQQIGYASEDLGEFVNLNEPPPYDTELGNIVTDAFRYKTGTDIAIQASGSIATILHEGPIVAADVYRSVGYGFNTVNGLGFRIAKFNMTGAAIWQGLETVLAFIEMGNDYIPDEYFPQVSGLNLCVNMENPAGSRIETVQIGDDVINPMATYSVTGNEFLVGFLEMLEIPFSDYYLYTDSSEFQVIVEYIASHSPLQAELGRISVCTGVEDETNISRPALAQNFPNPFETSTSIKFDVDKTEFVELTIYDISGLMVDKLVSQTLQPGAYDYKWTPKNAANGVYYYRLKCGESIESKCMIYKK